MIPLRPRRGIALFSALVLTILVGLLAAGAVASSRMQQHAWSMERLDASLGTAADYALASVVADADRLGLANLDLGRVLAIPISVADPQGVRATVAVTRLPGGILWLVADAGANGRDGGHRRVGLVARFPVLGPTPPGGIIARGGVQVSSDVVVVPDSAQEPDCAQAAVALVVTAPGAAVVGFDSARIAYSSVASDSASYFLTAGQLRALDETGRSTHVLGDTVLAGGSFDGILIVDGALTITGPFTMTGLLVARGRIVATGPATFTGAVLSFADESAGTPAIKFSGVTIRYSPCGVDRAMRHALDARAITRRSWAELF